MRTSVLRFLCLAVCIVIQFRPPGLQAAELTWDGDLTFPGPQDGGGNWNSVNTNWWNGVANVSWSNSTPDSAIFGVGTSGFGGTATVPAATTNTVAGIKFRVLGSGNYVITSANLTTSKLNLAGNPTIDVTNGVSPIISAVLTGSGFTKSGGGALTLNPGAFNVNTGATFVIGGTLVIGGGSANRRVIPGDLIVTNASTARLGQSENIINSAVVSLYAGSTFEMNSRNQTLSGLILDNATITQTSTETLTVTGTIDARSGMVVSASGKIDAGTFTKSTSGTMVLQTRGSTPAGGGFTNTVLNDGTLVLNYTQDSSKLLDSGTLIVNGGTLLFTNGTHTEEVGFVIVTNGVITNASGTVTLQVASGGTYDVRGGEIYTVLAGSGRTLTKSTAGTVLLGTTNTYTGDTAVNNGALLVNGSIGSGTVTVSAGALLGGNGTINGPVTVQSSGTLSAGTSIGQLTISNSLTLQSGSTTLMELTAGTNDLVRGLTSVNYGGTLVVTNLSSPPPGNPTFKLFDAAVYNGTFDTISLPPMDNGRTWDISGLTNNGTIKVISLPQIGTISIAPAGVIITGAGGTSGANYTVLTSTNVVLPLSVWTPVATNQFGVGGEFSFTNALDPATPQLFFIIRTP